MTIKILMVDDEPDAEVLFRQNFRKEIRKGVYEFLFAQSGTQALKILASADAPSLLLLLSDINMPGMTGLELLETVKQLKPELPVFMITAYGDADTAANAKSKGAQDLLTKPIDFKRLKDVLGVMTESMDS